MQGLRSARPLAEPAARPHREIATRRWTRREYDRLIELGVLHEDEPVELIDGQMVVKEPQSPYHATTIALVARALRRAFGPRWEIRQGLPIALGQRSEPEPDVTVVEGPPERYLTDHPALPALVVEVSRSRLAFDRGEKGDLYARAGIRDYWIVNLADRVLEVYREPARSRVSRPRWIYRSVRVLRPPAAVSPLARPRARVRVAELLPRLPPPRSV